MLSGERCGPCVGLPAGPVEMAGGPLAGLAGEIVRCRRHFAADTSPGTKNLITGFISIFA